MSGRAFARVERQPYVDWWEELFASGSAVFSRYDFFQRGRNSVWIAAADVDLRGLEPCDGVGLPFVRLGRRLWKPTAVAVLHFGATARRGFIEVTESEAVELLARRFIEPGPDDPRVVGLRGFVIARLRGAPIACIQWRRGRGESCVPKGRALDPVDLPPLLQRQA